MKSLFITALFIIFCGVVSAQLANLIIFTDEEEDFTLYLNALRQNPSPELNVKVTNLKGNYFQARIVFEDSNIEEIEKVIFVEPNKEVTYRIKKNNKGKLKMRYFSEVPLQNAAPRQEAQAVIIWENPANQTTPEELPVDDEPVEETNTNNNQQNNNQYTDYHYIMPGYGGAMGCPWPMTPQDFNMAKQSISKKSFSDDKMILSKQIIRSSCLFAAQVAELMLLFTFEDDRLELAKFAYDHTYDQGNYFKVNDSFTFSTSIDELNEYIYGE